MQRNIASAKDFSLAELKQLLAEGEAVIVDVREADEFSRGRIPGAILHPLSRLEPAALPRVGEGQQVIVMCRSGQRSRTALQIAHASGRDDIRGHYPGGILEWTGAGEPVERD